MKVNGLGWAGTKTANDTEMVNFLTEVMGIDAHEAADGLHVFCMPDGSYFEVFGPSNEGHECFTTGPVVGFHVDDLDNAVQALSAANIELLGGQRYHSGHGWMHFRAPDGNVYEVFQPGPDEEAMSRRLHEVRAAPEITITD